MNLDLLIKLVKLANNNPNENEANLAARKVCKIIAEGNYQFTSPKTAQQKVNFGGTWGGFKPAPTTPPPNYYDIHNDIQEMINRMNRDTERYWRTHTPRPTVRKTCTRCGVDIATDNTETPFVCGFCKLV